MYRHWPGMLCRADECCWKECGVVRAQLRELQRCSLVCRTVHGVKAAWEEPGTFQLLLAGIRAAGTKVAAESTWPSAPVVQGTLQEQKAGGRPG